MKKILLFAIVFITAISANAQFTTGWDRAMNFGGAGANVEEMRYVGSDLFFLARLMGKYQFAGNNYDAGAVGNNPSQDVIFGKITASGSQVLLKRITSADLEALTGAARIGVDGSLYVFRTGTGTSKIIGGVSTTAYGLQLVKLNPSGETDWIKKLNQFTDIEFGATVAPLPSIAAMQVKDDGNIYVIAKSNIIRGSIYPTRVLKLNTSGDEVWHYEMTSSNAGTSTAGILIDAMPKYFVDNAGNVTFIAATTGNISFNGTALPYETPNGNLKNWIISLNDSGTKKWNTSAYVLPLFYGVNPQSGNIYINYSYSRQSPAVPATIPPFSNLPNIAPPPAYDFLETIYGWSGIIQLNTSGDIAKARSNYINATAYPTQMHFADNGRILLFTATANGNLFKTDENFISFDGNGYAAMEVDGDFKPLKVFKLPAGSALALDGNKFAFGGTFKTPTTIGNITLTPNFIDTDFNTRFPMWASIKTDVLIAEGNLDNVPLTPPTTTWTGNTSTNWDIASNWTNGVPTENLRAVLSGSPINMPVISATAKAGQIQIIAGSEITFPAATSLAISDKIFNNGKINIENASFFSFFGVSDIKGDGEFNFKGASSIFNFNGSFSNTLSFNNSLEIVFSDLKVNSLKFVGTAAKLKGNITVTNPNVNAISGISATSFVNGTLTRAVNETGTYLFPLGTGTGANEKSTKLTFTPNNLIGTSQLAAKYTAGIPTGTTPNLTVNGSIVSSVLNGGFLTLTPNQQPTSGNYQIETSITGSDNAVPDPLKYILIKRQNSTSPWIFQGENTITPASTGSGTTSVVNVGLMGITSFSDFAVGIGSNPITLPVKLTKFVAKPESNSVLVTWETLTELNSDKFVVERSTDGVLFLPVGDVKAKGNSTQQISYSLRDKNPQSGLNYYRLKQIDLDGAIEYSLPYVIDFKLNQLDLTLYPNPVSERLRINGLNGKTGSIFIYALNGEKVASLVIKGNEVIIPAGIPNNIYMLTVHINDGSRHTQKILIKR